MCKADYYGSSITDERHFALYIKDTIDAGDGTTMVANGTMVDWEDVTEYCLRNTIGIQKFA